MLPSVNLSLYFYSNTNGKANENRNGNVNCHVNLAHTDDNVNETHMTKMSAMHGDFYDLNTIEKSNSKQNSNASKAEIPPTFSLSLAIQRIVKHMRTSYTNTTVIQWSILWAMSMCGFLQVRAIFTFSIVLPMG